ncbi:MAG: AGE family epimerase/isomerase [Bacteroidota bacterium]|nr:N-acylglucosamine 2-epimerase [Odoribacter sp.]MDP3642613.1 AGE family epimerase/isomerase [Bacteroidota bacterium]
MKPTVLLICTGILIFSCSSPEKVSQVSDQRIFNELSESLNKGILKVWYPRTIDSISGGFLSDFDYKWEMKGPQNKMIVTQSRHVWTCSSVAEFYPEKKDYYLKIARHGFQFLKDKMWDTRLGGFFTLVDREGNVLKSGKSDRIIKEAYGNAFAIYGLSAFARASSDTTALALAKKTFLWLDRHSYDPQYGGYFQFLEADGTPLKDGFNGTPPKDQNSSIHLLEAFTELYRVWPDPLVKNRLLMMLSLIRDRITNPKGYLQLYLNQDMSPVSYRDSAEEVRKKNWARDHISFGHDVETAFLMLEASEIAGLGNDTLTLRKARKMVDHSIKNGWDNAVGGFYDAGYYFKNQDTVTIIKDTKNWWAQAEGLNSLLMMAELFPDDQHNYKSLFLKEWEYVDKYLIDHEHGDWYEGGIDKEPGEKLAMKAQIWKGNYHTSRSLMNCLKRLKNKQETVKE